VEAVPALLIRTVRTDASSTVVAAAGDIDLASAPQLHRHLLVLPDRDTVLDMSGVSLLAAAGLTALLDTQDRLTRAGARLVLAAPSPPVRRALAITGLDTRLATAPTVEAGTKLITPAGQRRAPLHRSSACRPHRGNVATRE
jgi:anti-anti-sigma factor